MKRVWQQKHKIRKAITVQEHQSANQVIYCIFRGKNKLSYIWGFYLGQFRFVAKVTVVLAGQNIRPAFKKYFNGQFKAVIRAKYTTAVVMILSYTTL